MATAGRLFGGGLVVGTTVTSVIIGYLVNTRHELPGVNAARIVTAPQSTDLQKLKRGDQILKYGVPDRGPELHYYANHVLCYDQTKKTPLWVAEHITKDHIKGTANRKHSKFRRDPDIPEQFSAFNSDYWKSGWSRGHMAPAGDCKYSQMAMDETFYLSNILPQDIDNNMGFWNRFEMYCRDLTASFTDVYVISGPLMLPETDAKGNKFVKYQVIGDSNVAVPTHLFKIVTAENNPRKPNEPVALGVFIVPNKPITSAHKLKEFQVPLTEVEKLSGTTFLDKLDKSQTRNLCDVDSCEMMSVEKLELYFTARKLENANSVRVLDNIWNEMRDKGVTPDKYVIQVYQRKRKELEQTDKKVATILK
ncbi:nuclease EXOG, mitochondrial-like [Glandiceps talaboti]